MFKTLLDIPIAFNRVIGCLCGQGEDFGPPYAVPRGPAWGHGKLGAVAFCDEPLFNEGLPGFRPGSEEGTVESNGPEAALWFAHESDVQA